MIWVQFAATALVIVLAGQMHEAKRRLLHELFRDSRTHGGVERWDEVDGIAFDLVSGTGRSHCVPYRHTPVIRSNQ